MVVPQVMHPTCRFQDVSSVQIGAILQGQLTARHALCEPLDNGIRTEHGHSDSPAPPKFRDLLVGPTGFEPVFGSGHVFATLIDRFSASSALMSLADYAHTQLAGIIGLLA